MGLEVSTFIGGLTASWPLAGDLKSQGDDHLRLLKSVLQGTFPNASKAFYFPSAEAIATTQVLDATDMHNTQLIDTTAGNVAVTLPSGFTTTNKGWKVDIMKVSSDSNAVIVSPASGTIASKCGSTATIRVGILCEPATFLWTGTGWVCSKPGPMIGSTESFDGATTPPGYLDADGSAFSSTSFAELFAILASSTLRDKRGRVEAGVDGGAGRLTATGLGTAAVLGATNSVAAAETKTIAQANLPNVNFNVTAATTGNGVIQTTALGSAVAAAGALIGGQSGGTTLGSANVSGTAASGGSGTALSVVQSTIVVKKIVRAC